MLLTLDDVVLAYDYHRSETDQPPVLFLHGALGVRGQFDAIRQSFPERSHITLDFAAHGESEARFESMNAERLACDVRALLEALGVEQVDIIGHSLGGYVGLVLATLSPARVKSIVNLGTKFYWTDEAIDKTLSGLDADSLRRQSSRYYEGLVALHKHGADKTLRLTQSLIADFRRAQLTEAMVSSASVPILLCCGDRDNLVPPSEVAKLFESLHARPNAMAIFPNTPHPLHHLPVECVEQAVRRFWSSAL